MGLESELQTIGHSGIGTGVARVQIYVKDKKYYYAVLMKQLFQLSWSSWPPHWNATGAVYSKPLKDTGQSLKVKDCPSDLRT